MGALQLTTILAVPLAAYGLSGGPPPKRTGAAVDGGVTCTACHNTYAPANSDPRGKVTISAGSYTPGVKQWVWVTVEHPEAARWGFQLTARLASDETKQAGTFKATSEIRVRCDPSGDAPCNGGLEFASHVGASTRAGTPNKASWAVDWTPPSTDAGDVVFYAAGNAADNSSTPVGDRIYNTSLKAASAGCGSLTAAPVITGVVNAGSYRQQDGIAMNTMLAIYGTGFAPPGTSRVVGASDIVENKFPETLSCVDVEIAGLGARVTYVSDKQVNVQAPTNLPFGPAEVEVKLNKNQPKEVKGKFSGVQVRTYSPAFFQFLPSSSIAAQIAPNFEVLARPEVHPQGRPVKPGEVAILYGTGFGPSDPVWQAGDIPPFASKIRDPISLRIGEVLLARDDIVYAGLSPGSISGLYQINARVPAATPDGDIPVEIEIGGMKTQPGAFIPVKRVTTISPGTPIVGPPQ